MHCSPSEGLWAKYGSQLLERKLSKAQIMQTDIEESVPIMDQDGEIMALRMTDKSMTNSAKILTDGLKSPKNPPGNCLPEPQIPNKNAGKMPLLEASNPQNRRTAIGASRVLWRRIDGQCSLGCSHTRCLSSGVRRGADANRSLEVADDSEKSGARTGVEEITGVTLMSKNTSTKPSSKDVQLERDAIHVLKMQKINPIYPAILRSMSDKIRFWRGGIDNMTTQSFVLSTITVMG
ncbi:hypothetical protein C8J56DRAFT_896262 [Mycena floridula]|nr:hypothetical protein C8J56DRAFT_896262 [Mycena floridula]